MAVISESLRRLVAAGASSLLRNELDDGPHSASSLSSTLSSTVPDPPSSLPSSLPCTLTSSVLDPPVPVGEPLFPLGWLTDYPGLRLKRLDLQFNFPEEESNQTSKFDATREALDLFGCSDDSACVTFLSGHHCQSTISTVLESPYLTELRLVNCSYIGDDGILGAMTRAIAQTHNLGKLV